MGNRCRRLKKRIEAHFGFQVVLARTEVGGYCSHCQALRRQEIDDVRQRQVEAAKTGDAPAHRSMTASSSIPPRRATLSVTDPNGNRNQIVVQSVPFRIGRQPDSDLLIRDSRASRNHARIVVEDGDYFLEDSGSRHGTLVNGARVARQKLNDADRIEFGFADSYQIVFELGPGRPADPIEGGLPAAGSNLSKLRAVLEMARTLETSGSTQDVLVALVDAALTVTGTERGFLLLRRGEELEMRVARDRRGFPLPENELRVPRSVIRRALERRRELLSMNFDTQEDGAGGHSVVDLDLRSVVCVPLVRIRTSDGDATNVLASTSDTVGVLYMDSRAGMADLSAGNRELLQALAIEASTILENARLLEEERAKQRIEEELNLARTIQQSLLPRVLPSAGWFRAAGSSVASHQVGGDYYDVVRIDETTWGAVVADVSGKGVGSALLASFLQGAFIAASANVPVPETMRQINRFLSDRTEGEKYATVFYMRITATGALHYINAGHCPPLLLSSSGAVRTLRPRPCLSACSPRRSLKPLTQAFRRGTRL